MFIFTSGSPIVSPSLANVRVALTGSRKHSDSTHLNTARKPFVAVERPCTAGLGILSSACVTVVSAALESLILSGTSFSAASCWVAMEARCSAGVVSAGALSSVAAVVS